MNLVLNTGPTVEPITLDEAKAQLRVVEAATEEDTYIERLIRAARDECEKRSLHALLTQTWELYLDEFPGESYIELPKPPLSSITSITYTTEDGNPDSPTTLATSVYYADTNRIPGRVVLKPDQEWPSDSLYPSGAVCITFVCGYTAAKDIPEAARQWMFLQISDWFENREPVLMGQGNSVVAHPMWDGLLNDMRFKAISW